MVTFTCNNCGDSTKKNRVEKHYTIECRRKTGGPNVCCIDCLKDFRQDYESHTSCQTEDERYSAKGTFVAKEAKNKQLKKQMTWSEIIQNVSKTNKNLSQSFKDILDTIKDSENVPRKEAKFKNFCKNNCHLRRFTEKDIMSVFNLIQEEMKQVQEAAKLEQQQTLAAAKEKKNIDQSEAKKRSISESDENQEQVQQAKKMKTENTEDIVGSKKDKKKKKSNDNDMEMNDEENNETPATTNGIGSNKKLTKAEKKKKKKAENTDVEVQDPETEAISNGVKNGENLTKMNKKKNKKLLKASEKKTEVEETKTSNGVHTSGIETVDETLTNGTSKKKKKNKKHSAELKENNEHPKEIKTEPDTTVAGDELNTSVNNKTPKKKRKSNEPEKTPFKVIIAKLLIPGKEFKLKALKKMVFAVYKSGEEEVPREVRENFNKKLSKIPNVQVNEKIVKMVK
ncbi:hypothetical protein WDU94_013358 [Cyamophila willieti]